MKLVSYKIHDKINIGALKEDFIVPFSNDPNIPNNMLSFLEAGKKVMTLAEDVVKKNQNIIPMDSCRLINPILRPPKIIAIGLNYQDHLEEIRAIGREVDDPEVPMIFNKQSTSACGPFEDIHDPKVSDKLDYEGELAFVIGKKCRHVPRSEAHNVIAGYCVSNDVSVRDWQLRVPTFTIGKSFDTHCPFGPAIVTADEISDPHNLQIKTEVNQEVRQNSNTKNLIFNCFELVEHLSTSFTLEPGDLILSGTPSGVGVADNKFLKEGDEVKISISELGYIENKVVNEPLSTIAY
ncbi:MAG: fumarylacetoacetate hydrolase family protein [Alphaproteobacteria bacterium]|tara:strand:+ start:741 stop:1622 length:882 start_codon:yes stop_codon:yes gene_type:complete